MCGGERTWRGGRSSPGAVVEKCACVLESLGALAAGDDSGLGEKGRALQSPWNLIFNHAAWSFQTAVFPRGPFPHASLACCFSGTRADFPRPHFLYPAKRRGREGAGHKAHAQPLHSRLRAAGTASAVCACALRRCGFNSFRVCLQLDPCFELRV